MTLLKLCGNHSLLDLKMAAKSNADFIGIIFAESKRKVKPEVVAEWLKQVCIPNHQKLVGVFVNPSIADIETICNLVPLDIIQLHGNETFNQILEIKDHFGLPIFKAIHHSPPESYVKMQQVLDLVEGFIIDSKVKGAWGGTGIKFAWEAIPQYTKLAKQHHKVCLIAGGITPENINECLEYEPLGIDLASGIEQDGMKDQELLILLEERIVAYEQNISGH